MSSLAVATNVTIDPPGDPVDPTAALILTGTYQAVAQLRIELTPAGGAAKDLGAAGLDGVGTWGFVIAAVELDFDTDYTVRAADDLVAPTAQAAQDFHTMADEVAMPVSDPEA
jgi:hypothetical protein